METRRCAVEQPIRELEQGYLKNYVEVSRLLALENEDPLIVVRNLANKLNIDDPEVLTAKRVGSYGEKPRYIPVR
ncbi:unnamed protein product [Parnassius apollo]|uniref:(apollo) hypothetical protein n=1 Tax=Parnassius apollo TaxID=110799 RepID=A0A8S3YCM0_PARAO|nr:unnamed protein product [Parnassius apollo]